MGTGLAVREDAHLKENLMATSPLAGGAPQVPQRSPGTGSDALGPSDTSDSASDIVGADGAVDAARGREPRRELGEELLPAAHGDGLAGEAS